MLNEVGLEPFTMNSYTVEKSLGDFIVVRVDVTVLRNTSGCFQVVLELWLSPVLNLYLQMHVARTEEQ